MLCYRIHCKTSGIECEVTLKYTHLYSLWALLRNSQPKHLVLHQAGKTSKQRKCTRLKRAVPSTVHTTYAKLGRLEGGRLEGGRREERTTIVQL